MPRVRNLNLTKESLEFIRGLEPKHFKQVMNKVLGLLNDPTPADSSALKGYTDLLRTDIGEYRIVYRFDETSVSVLIVDKRNDDEVYKKLSRKNI
jgi:mRNA interferase RelE/StbE